MPSWHARSVPASATAASRCWSPRRARSPTRATWVHENGGTAPRYRGLDLWLQTPCLGRVLWALDETHLDFLERYVAAGLREEEPINRSLASRLPRWIKAAKHRNAVTRALTRLRATLPA